MKSGRIAEQSRKQTGTETETRRGPRIEMVKLVGDEIARLMERDRRFRFVSKTGMEFLVAMGLLVRDPAERARVMHIAVGSTLLASATRPALAVSPSCAPVRRIVRAAS
jgi:hypothetical protein